MHPKLYLKKNQLIHDFKIPSCVIRRKVLRHSSGSSCMKNVLKPWILRSIKASELSGSQPPLLTIKDSSVPAGPAIRGSNSALVPLCSVLLLLLSNWFLFVCFNSFSSCLFSLTWVIVQSNRFCFYIGTSSNSNYFLLSKSESRDKKARLQALNIKEKKKKNTEHKTSSNTNTAFCMLNTKWGILIMVAALFSTALSQEYLPLLN